METSLQLKKAISDYKQGNRDAFTIIYRESEKCTYSIIYKVVQGNDNALDMTADIMGDTYLTISQRLDQLEDDEKFFSWVRTIATRSCYAYIKKNKREILLQEDDTTFEQLPDDDKIIPEEVMQNREAQRLLREIIDHELNEMQKLCVIGFYYNELKQSEIATELGIPENTVKTNLSRARAKIRAGVEELNIKKGTRLFSVAPLMVLLFNEDAQACEVPVQIGAKVLAAVGVSVKGAGATAAGHAMAGKAALKMKVIGMAAAVGVVGCGAGVAIYRNNHPANTWERAYENYIQENEDIAGFDLNDFDGDGIPEMVVNQNDEQISILRYIDDDLLEIESDPIGLADSSKLEEAYDEVQTTCGYGVDQEELIFFKESYMKCKDGHIWTPQIIDKHLNNYGPVDVVLYGENMAVSANEDEKHAYEYSTFTCYRSDEDTKTECPFEEWFAGADAIMQRFHAIDYAGVSKDEVRARIAEYKANGDRVRENGGLDWDRFDVRGVKEMNFGYTAAGEQDHMPESDTDSASDSGEPEEEIDLNELCDKYHEQLGGDELYRIVHDFDKDGRQEAYLILGQYSSEGSHTVEHFLFFNSKGEMTDVPVTSDREPAFYGYVAEDKFIETADRDYFVWEKDAFGSASVSYIFSAKNGEYFEPKVSGEYMNFGTQDGTIKGWSSDFSAGYHDYIETEFKVDRKTGEFKIKK